MGSIQPRGRFTNPFSPLFMVLILTVVITLQNRTSMPSWRSQVTSAGRRLPGGRQWRVPSERSLAHCSQPSNPWALSDPSSFSFPLRVQRSGRARKDVLFVMPNHTTHFSGSVSPCQVGVITILQREERQSSKPFSPPTRHECCIAHSQGNAKGLQFQGRIPQLSLSFRTPSPGQNLDNS